MSATKRHLENLTEKHKLYSLGSTEERRYYRFALLDCSAGLCERMASVADDRELEVIHEMIDLLHSIYDECKAVDDWNPVD